MFDEMTAGTIANPIVMVKLMELAKQLYDEDGIGPHDMVLALMCFAVAIIEAALPDAPADMKRAGLHQMIDGVVLRTKQ